jgi:hypothetical protein
MFATEGLVSPLSRVCIRGDAEINRRSLLLTATDADKLPCPWRHIPQLRGIIAACLHWSETSILTAEDD